MTIPNTDKYPGTPQDALFELRSAATDYDVMMSAEGFERAVAEIRRKAYQEGRASVTSQMAAWRLMSGVERANG